MLNKCSTNIEENTYFIIVRPLLEYAACFWDPYQEYMTLKKFNDKLQHGFFLITIIIAV